MTTVLSDYWDALAWERSGPKAKLAAAQIKKVLYIASISIPHKSSRTAELNTEAIKLFFSCRLNLQFLGVFPKFWRMNISFVMTVCPSVRPSAENTSAPNGQILMKFDVLNVFKKCFENIPWEQL